MACVDGFFFITLYSMPLIPEVLYLHFSPISVSFSVWGLGFEVVHCECGRKFTGGETATSAILMMS
jgi:hypothetical protein